MTSIFSLHLLCFPTNPWPGAAEFGRRGAVASRHAAAEAPQRSGEFPQFLRGLARLRGRVGCQSPSKIAEVIWGSKKGGFLYRFLSDVPLQDLVWTLSLFLSCIFFFRYYNRSPPKRCGDVAANTPWNTKIGGWHTSSNHYGDGIRWGISSWESPCSMGMLQCIMGSSKSTRTRISMRERFGNSEYLPSSIFRKGYRTWSI